ncbi:hypothetical protein [Streptomyces sp. NPDC057284]|uniref:hypothetical protein n=1 Tax=Streptomyces sp. NPDC057284 TaxID=3346083 RepID=UPI0036443365
MSRVSLRCSSPCRNPTVCGSTECNGPSRRHEIRLPLHPGERLTYRRVKHREIRQRAALPSERRLCPAPAPRARKSAALLSALSATTVPRTRTRRADCGQSKTQSPRNLMPVPDALDRLNAAAAAVPTVPRPDRPDEGEPLASHHPTGAVRCEDTLPASLARPVI